MCLHIKIPQVWASSHFVKTTQTVFDFITGLFNTIWFEKLSTKTVFTKKIETFNCIKVYCMDQFLHSLKTNCLRKRTLLINF